jgi:hypothetical protein
VLGKGAAQEETKNSQPMKQGPAEPSLEKRPTLEVFPGFQDVRRLEERPIKVIGIGEACL